MKILEGTIGIVASAAATVCLLTALSCASRLEPPAPPPDLGLHEILETPDVDRPRLLDTAGGLVLFGHSKDKDRVWISENEGASWSERAALPIIYRTWAVHEGCPDLHRLEADEEGLFHVRGLEGGAERSRITDTLASEMVMTIAADGRLGVVWIERGRGWPEAMFSQSLDHGASWSPAVRVNTASRRKEVASIVLLSHRGGWAAVWMENRDPRTLFDLFGSFSQDGEQWEPSQRLNDDQEPAFSVSPVAVEDGRVVHVLAQDYRERNRFDDRDGDIYYSRMSVDRGATSPNVRVNDVTDAFQSVPSLARDTRTGALVAAWIDARHRLTGDIYASVSGNGGSSWSPNRRINVNVRPEVMTAPAVTPRRAGGAYVLWQQVHGARKRSFIRRLVPGEQRADSPETLSLPANPVGPLIQPLPARRLLMRERFDRGTLGSVRPLAGSWIVHSGLLLGFGYGPAFAEWTDRPLGDFIVEGRFRLDPRHHVAAHLFLRVRRVPDEPGVFEGYQLRNHFRRGVLLSRTRYVIAPGRPPAILGTEPIGDRWLPLRQETWYAFRAAVRGRKLDYWLDGAWVLSADGLDPHPGVVGIGTDARGPVEWDDLALHTLGSIPGD